MKLQLPRDKNGNFESFIFDDQKEKIMLDSNNVSDIFSKGKVFKCIIECAKVWVYNGRIGSIWNVVQLKFTENKFHQAIGNNSTEVYTQLMID
jgi:hypothetical protein